MEKLTFRDYVRIIFKEKWVIVLTVFLAVAAVRINLYLQTPRFMAEVKMLVSAQKVIESPYYLQLGASQGSLAAKTQAEIVKSNPVLERTLRVVGIKPYDYEKYFSHSIKRMLIERNVRKREEEFARLGISKEQIQVNLHRTALEDLRANIEVKPIRDSNMFTIAYSDYSPQAAASIANIISRSYVIFDLEQQLAELQTKYGEKNLAVTQLNDSILKMTKNLNGEPLPDVEAIGPASVKIIEQAIVPLSTEGPSDRDMLLLAVFLSGILGMMLAFLYDYLDQKFKTPRDVLESLNLPCIGSIPRRARIESYRRIAEEIAFKMNEKNLKTVLVTSAMPGEGVSTVTVNLARTICLKPKCNVLIVDGNLKRPVLRKRMKIAGEWGLSDVVDGKAGLEDAIVKVNECLSVLPAGKADLGPVNFFDSAKMAGIFNAAANAFDVILIDGGNLKESKVSLRWSAYAQTALIVVDSRRSSKHAVKYELEPLSAGRVDLMGVILNNRTFAIPSFVYKRI